jgi:dihydroorotate dehydrogenase
MNRSEPSRPRIPAYEAFFRLVLQRFQSERAHRFAERSMRLIARLPGALALLDWILRPREQGLEVRAMGCDFRTPLGVAAGMDKNARWFDPLMALGFGAVEVGTVTACRQEGNLARPRVSRLPHDRALINALGFPSDGAEEVAERLAKRRVAGVLGINVGKSRSAEIDAAVDDYRHSVRVLAPRADYLVLNVSSPNTPGLTSMQTVVQLKALIEGVREELAESPAASALPLLLKLGPDLPDREIESIAEMAVQMELDGIVAVNTTKDTSIATRSDACLAAQTHGGGLSGRPLADRALEVLNLLHAKVGGRIDLISVGGVESGADAWRRILAGATLVQAHTAFVYGGPLWPRRFNRDLAKCLRESQWSSIGEAIGRGAPPISIADEDSPSSQASNGTINARHGATV